VNAGAARIEVVEGRSWDLPGEAEPWVAWVEGARWGVVGGGAALSVPFAAGRVFVELRRGAQVRPVELTVLPDPDKLGPEAWQALIADLEQAEPGVVANLQVPRAWGTRAGGIDKPAVVVALLSLIDAWIRALDAALSHPREVAVSAVRERPLHRVGAADPSLLAWLSAHPREAAWIDPRVDPGRSGPPPHIPVVAVRPTLDHAVHRHLVWLLLRVAARFSGASTQVAGSDPVRDLRAVALGEAAARLRRFWRTGPLSQVQPAPAADEALLVLVGDPRYAQVHRLGRTLLTLGLDAGQSGEVPTEQTFDLYERWCWHRVIALARRHFPACPSRAPPAVHNARCSWVDGDTTWTVYFNLTFPRNDGGGWRSVTSDRRPDLVVHRQGPEGARYAAVDAKYRAGEAMLTDALNTAHIYRDALRGGEADGPPRGVLLLIPRAPATTSPWFQPAWVRREGVGFLELRPGLETDPWPMLRGWLEGSGHGVP
jgi:hypothetical protein